VVAIDSDPVENPNNKEVVMPRRPRLYLPNQPQHVVVRGHNRDPILARHDDFRFLYSCLRDAKEANGLAVHAWVFMHNHIHLLVTPSDEQSLPRTMQSLGRRYAQYFNRTYHRSGSLWEGRYKSSLVNTDHYLLACYRYIELNPVRAGIARRPEDYPYSSFHANALGKPDSVITPHSVYLELQGSESLVQGFDESLPSDANDSDLATAASTPRYRSQEKR
jgi:putative transposase